MDFYLESGSALLRLTGVLLHQDVYLHYIPGELLKMQTSPRTME